MGLPHWVAISAVCLFLGCKKQTPVADSPTPTTPATDTIKPPTLPITAILSSTFNAGINGHPSSTLAKAQFFLNGKATADGPSTIKYNGLPMIFKTSNGNEQFVYLNTFSGLSNATYNWSVVAAARYPEINDTLITSPILPAKSAILYLDTSNTLYPEFGFSFHSSKNNCDSLVVSIESGTVHVQRSTAGTDTSFNFSAEQLTAFKGTGSATLSVLSCNTHTIKTPNGILLVRSLYNNPLKLHLK